MSNETKPVEKKEITREQFAVSLVNIVSNDIEQYQKNTGLVLPEDYAVGNAIQAAYLNILTVKDKNSQSAIKVCDQRSIINAVRNMVVQGLNVDKKQGYFIVYGNELTFMRSYFGTIAVAKRFSGLLTEPIATIVLKGDKVVKEIVEGETRVVSHTSEWPDDKAITKDDIVAAYCLVKTKNGNRHEYMIKSQIQASWNKSKTSQGVHAEFPDQMAKRTVINRALKLLINSSDDNPILVKAFNESGYVGDNEEKILDDVPEISFTETVTPTEDEEVTQSSVPNTTAKQMSITDETEPF